MSTTSNVPPEDDPVVVQSATGTMRASADDDREIKPKGFLFIAAVAFGQFGLFVALFAPIMIGLAIKINELTDDNVERTSIMSYTFAAAGIAAFLGNSFGGRLSDRNMSRLGKRRPYFIGGVLLMALAFFVIVIAPSGPVIAVAWFIGQLGANFAYGPFTATLADQLPKEQYARVSAVIGIMQNVAIFAATWLATQLQANILAMFMVPALIAVVAMVVYFFVLPDKVLREKPEKFNFLTLIKTFWVNPIKFPDFGFAWWSRFLIIFGNSMFTTYRFFFLQDQLEVPEADVAGVVTQGILYYTITLIIAGYVVAWLSDKIGRRKVFIASAAVIFAIGTYLLLHIETIEQFYLVEALIGVGYGVYMAIDLAIVLEVLPNEKDSGKDLGVFNLANTIPGTLAPAVAGPLLAFGVAAGGLPNYGLMLTVAAVACLAGAVAILFVKRVK